MRPCCALVVATLCGCEAARSPEPDAGTPVDPDDGDAGTPPRPLGATLTADGVAFNVWAPHATAAYVEGDFTDGRIEMSPEAGGLFGATASLQPGQRYRYVLETPAGSLTRVDPYCRELTVDRAWCTLIDPGAYAWSTTAFARPSRSQAVVYELHVGTFGTFAKAQEQLAGLAELGVNVVELMPVNAFGGRPNGWGYNPQLYLAVKPTYGTADGLKAFIDEAHRLGIAVWHDTVLNHTDGWRQAPLACFDGVCPDGSWGIYFFAPGPYALTPWGPRPNYLEPRVTTMLLDSVKQWLTEYRGDGFRFDSVSNVRALDGQGTTPGGRELLVQANALAHQAGALSVAEDLKGYDAITNSASSGGFGFDAQWDGFGYDVAGLLAGYADDARDLGVVERALKGGFGGDPFARLIWTENHDTVGNGGARLPVKIDAADPESFAARRRSMLGAALLFTTPGVPMLFMGQEQLATVGFTDPPPALPTPTTRGLEVRAFYKDLIALRRSVVGLQGPDVEVLHRNDPDKVIAYRRHDTVVVLNLRNRPFTRYDFGVPSGGTWKVRLDADWKQYGADFSGGNPGSLAAVAQPRDGKPYMLSAALGAYGALVLTK